MNSGRRSFSKGLKKNGMKSPRTWKKRMTGLKGSRYTGMTSMIEAKSMSAEKNRSEAKNSNEKKKMTDRSASSCHCATNKNGKVRIAAEHNSGNRFHRTGSSILNSETAR
jgi:hypothetical protein